LIGINYQNKLKSIDFYMINKSNNEIAALIEHNLHDLYIFIANKCNNYKLHLSDNFSFIKSETSSWPNFIFNTILTENFENYITKINKDIENNIIPPLWVVSPNSKPDNLGDLIENYGFRLTMQWPGMALDLVNFKYKYPPNDIEVKQVINLQDLNDWFNIVNYELFPFKKFKENIFESLLYDKQVKLLIAKINDIPVATSMLFVSSGVAGIYMVAVSQKYRKKGLGTIITLKTIDEAIKLNCEICCLQSTEMAENMYKSIGFKEFCKFDIYWKVGKF